MMVFGSSDGGEVPGSRTRWEEPSRAAAAAADDEIENADEELPPVGCR